jgi:hypothetical protein
MLDDGIEQDVSVGELVIILQDGGYCLLMQEKLGDLS